MLEDEDYSFLKEKIENINKKSLKEKEKIEKLFPKFFDFLNRRKHLEEPNLEVLSEIENLEEYKFGQIRKEQNLTGIESEEAIKNLINYMKNNFVFGYTVGINGAGKSTFFKKYAVKGAYPDLKYIDLDEFWEGFYGKSHSKYWRSYISPQIKEKKSFILEGHSLEKIERTSYLYKSKKFEEEKNKCDILYIIYEN